jgi:sugar phosphate permease
MSTRAVLFATYATECLYYIVRKALSINKASYQSELGLSTMDLGVVDAAFLASYTLGGFAAGHAGDAYGGRRVITAALAGTGFCLLALGTARSASQLTFWSAVHGFFQATGYPACIKLLSEWVVGEGKGRIMGLWGTCCAVGGCLGMVGGTFLLNRFGWQATFLVPAPLMFAMSAYCYTTLVDTRPSGAMAEVGEGVQLEVELSETDGGGNGGSGGGEFGSTKSPEDESAAMLAGSTSKQLPQLLLSRPKPSLRDAMRVPDVLRAGCAYFFLKFASYVLMLWLPYYHHTALGYDLAVSGYLATSFEIGGIFGSILFGFLTDRWFGGRSVACTIAMVTGAGAVLVLYTMVPKVNWQLSALLMTIIGVLISGGHYSVPTIVTQDLSARSVYGMAVVGSVTGVVNGLGSFGTVVQGVLTPWISRRFGWQGVFYLLTAFCFIGGAVLLPAAARERALSTGRSSR